MATCVPAAATLAAAANGNAPPTWSPEPETPPPGHHLRKIKKKKIFKRPKNHGDSTDFDDVLTKIIAATRPIF